MFSVLLRKSIHTQALKKSNDCYLMVVGFGQSQRHATTTQIVKSKQKFPPTKKTKTKNINMQNQQQHKPKCQRQWVPCGGNCSVADDSLKKYTLLSYNILAQDLLVEHLYLYPYDQPDLLKWGYRRERLRKEICQLNPDIICLQEMQYDHLKGFVCQLRSCGRRLEYVYKKKTGFRTDGCAIIWDRDKFQLQQDLGVEFYTPGVALLNRENVALLASFRVKEEPTKRFVVATTHLLYNPRREDVRMAQIEVLLAKLKDFSHCDGGGGQERLPIILTGDFNLQANTRAYALLTGRCPEKSTCSANCLELAALDFGGNYTASTYQNAWVTVDYILHSLDRNKERFKIWSTYQLPALNDCARIPNLDLGSDHFSLAMQFSVV